MGPHFSVVGVGQEHGTRRGDADQRAVRALRDQALARSARPPSGAGCGWSGPGAVVGAGGSGPGSSPRRSTPDVPRVPCTPSGPEFGALVTIYRRVGCPNLLQRPRSGRSAERESLIFRASSRGRSGRGAPLQQIWTRPAPDRPRSPTRTTPCPPIPAGDRSRPGQPARAGPRERVTAPGPESIAARHPTGPPSHARPSRNSHSRRMRPPSTSKTSRERSPSSLTSRVTTRPRPRSTVMSRQEKAVPVPS